jgi:glycine dehydrogenase subunit 1
MRYTPHTPSDQEQMLRTIGIDSIEQLYQHIPETLRNRAKIKLPGGLTELAVAGPSPRWPHATQRQRTGVFLGAGSITIHPERGGHHLRSVLPLPTPYQPSQPGYPQALFEYQTLIINSPEWKYPTLESMTERLLQLKRYSCRDVFSP